jgi:hypothetical protein
MVSIGNIVGLKTNLRLRACDVDQPPVPIEDERYLR